MRCQLAAICCAKDDLAGNLATHLRLVADAASAGCQLVLFPEMSLTGSVDPAVSPGRLLTLGHPAIARLAEASGETGVGVCFGGAVRRRAWGAERTGEPPRRPIRDRGESHAAPPLYGLLAPRWPAGAADMLRTETYRCLQHRPRRAVL